MISLERMRDKLRAAVAAAGGQAAWAKANDLSPQYVCDCLHGRKRISVSLARRLGYKPVTAYVPVEDE